MDIPPFLPRNFLMDKIYNTAEKLNLSFILSLFVILISCFYMIFNNYNTNFLNCDMECGETLIALAAADQYAQYGPLHGLLEMLDIPPGKPKLYTHNVNIGGLFLIGLEALGVPSQFRLLFPLLIYASGLVYVYLTMRKVTYSDNAAFLAVILFATTYWGLGAFALNPLRIWHLLAYFMLTFHTIQLSENKSNKTALFGIALGATGSFGCGYDFWVISGFTTLALVFMNRYDGYKGRILKNVIAISIIFSLPFILQQIRVAMVLGVDFWLHDVIYSVAIKVPYGNKIISIPSLEAIDAYYAAHNVFRPPAYPGNNVCQIFYTLSHMVQYITIPRWGIISLLTMITVIFAGVCPWPKESRLRIFSFKLIIPMIIGIILGIFIFSPFSLHVYFKHEFPLLAFPILLTKAYILYSLLQLAFQRHKHMLNGIAIASVLLYLVDIVMVNWNNTNHSEYPNYGWLKYYREHPNSSFTLSVYRLPISADTLYGITRPNMKSLHIIDKRNIIAVDTEFFVYQPVDYILDFDRQAPHCKWKWWLHEVIKWGGKPDEGVNCIYGYTLKGRPIKNPPSILEITNSIQNYKIVEQSDKGIGYVVMKRKPN